VNSQLILNLNKKFIFFSPPSLVTMSSLSVLRTSSLSSLAAASQSVGNSDAVVSGDRPSASGGVGSASSGSGSGDSARIAGLLERLVDRVERLEEKQSQSGRLVRDRPPTPAPLASSSASLSLSGPSGGHGSSLNPNSMSAFLSAGGGSGGGARRGAVREVVTVDSDSEDEKDAAPTAHHVASLASSAAREHPLFMPLAPSIIQDVGKAGFQAWLRAEAPKEEWKKIRNRNECELLAQALDALVLDNDADAAIEILARRFVGVKHADQSGNWHFADVLAKDMPKRTLLRPSVLSCVLREAKNLTLLESGGYRGSGGGRNQDGGDRQFRRDGRDGRGRDDFRARGGRSAQPNSGGDGRRGGGRFQGQANSNNSNSNSTSSSAAASSANNNHGGSTQGAGRGGNGQ
jgi:hypothetical protein